MRYIILTVLFTIQMLNSCGATRYNRDLHLANELLPKIVQVHLNWAETIQRLVPNPAIHIQPIFRNSDVRDGLQAYALNGKPLVVNPEIRARQIAAAAPFFTHFDAISLANPERVPQMGGADSVLDSLDSLLQPQCQALVMNERGFNEFLKLGLPQWNGTIGVDDSFNMNNMNITFDQGVVMYGNMIKTWQKVPEKSIFRGAVKQNPWCFLSNAFHHPYTLEPVDQEDVEGCIFKLKEIGFKKIILSDTSGQARLHEVYQLLNYLRTCNVCFDDLGGHFHGDEAPCNAALAFAMGVPLIDLTTLESPEAGGCNTLKEDSQTGQVKPKVNLNNTRASHFFALLKALGYINIPSYEVVREFEKTSPLSTYLNYKKIAYQFEGEAKNDQVVEETRNNQ